MPTEPSATTIDLQLHAWLQGLREPWLDLLLAMVTELGGAWVTAPVAGGIALWLAWRRLWPALGYWLAAAIVVRLSIALLKQQLARARPGNFYSGVESFSFPSGHATTATVLYGLVAVLLAAGLPRAGRLMLYGGAALLIILIGFSRLYLGVHWFTDVVAGFALGLAGLLLLVRLFRRLPPAQQPPTRTLALLFCTLLMGAAALRLGLALDSVVANYQLALYPPALSVPLA